MSQVVVKNKLCRFLQLTHPKSTVQLRKDLRKNGYCYGMSICFATMHLIGKLDWWEAALIKIVNWDGSAKSLKKPANLPNSENPAETLEQVCERVLNYIVYNQATDEPSHEPFLLDAISQPRFLLPNNPYFELLHKNKIKKIKQRYCVPGYHTVNTLTTMMNKELLTGNICLIHNTFHTISASYKAPYWLLYDPNSAHKVKKGESIILRFEDKASFIEALIRIQGNSIAVEYASLDGAKEIKSSLFTSFYKRNPLELLKEYGFHLVVTEVPAKLPEILANTKQRTKLANLLASVLAEPDDSDWPGLHKLLWYSPEHLALIMDYIKNVKEGPDLIATALFYSESEYGWNGLYLVLKYAPDMLLTVLNYVSQSQDGLDIISLLLMKANKKNESGFYHLLKHTPDAFLEVLEFVKHSLVGPDCLARALLKRTKDGKTGWDLINSEFLNVKQPIIEILLKNNHLITAESAKRLLREMNSSINKYSPLKKIKPQHHTFFKDTNSDDPTDRLLTQLTERFATRKKWDKVQLNRLSMI